MKEAAPKRRPFFLLILLKNNVDQSENLRIGVVFEGHLFCF